MRRMRVLAVCLRIEGVVEVRSLSFSSSSVFWTAQYEYRTSVTRSLLLEISWLEIS